MPIRCPTCATSYHVDPLDIEDGRMVICTSCDARWFVDGLGGAAPAFMAIPQLTGPARPIDAAPPGGATARSPARRSRPRVPRSVAFGLASLALVSLTIGARARIIQLVPRSAALYAAAGMPVNLRGLEFRDVHVARLDPSSPLVTISGKIRNVSSRRVHVPRLVFEVRDAAGQSLVRWSERASARLIARGTLAFASAPHQIPADSRSALVHFESDDPS